MSSKKKYLRPPTEFERLADPEGRRRATDPTLTANGNTRANRAAQFMPFSALTGYYELVRKQEITVEERHELTEEKARESFGFLMDAYKFGAPPHGGMAYGLDRMVMLMLKKDSIRDVIAFPKVANSSELMSGAPAIVDDQQLVDLDIHLITEASDDED